MTWAGRGRSAVAAGAVALAFLAGCTNNESRVEFDGNYYPAKVAAAKADRKSFVVTVRNAGQGVNGAREAGRHAAVKYCVETFGYSGIDWVNGPDGRTGPLHSTRKGLVFRGRCRVWE